MIYRVIIEKGEDFGYIAHCPAIPGCHSQGKTMEEAIENIKAFRKAGFTDAPRRGKGSQDRGANI
ncbi:MAG: type II toxin-antitoxin system HicB family antitoxin [Syntrophales bacterium]|nr:type II toxin-antitoxin system HicB family antitoxin [Syntrophales bacterium]